MFILLNNLDYLVMFIGAFVGSMKASVEFYKGKGCFGRTLDVVIGIFCGVMLAHHFRNDNSIALSGVLALVGGVSGATVIEVFMQMIPNIAKTFIKKLVAKL